MSQSVKETLSTDQFTIKLLKERKDMIVSFEDDFIKISYIHY